MKESVQDIAAKQLLKELAEINRLLRDHSVALRRLASVTVAQAFPLEAVSYTTGPGLEGCVEAKLTNGDVVVWCLDVNWDQNAWTIEATLDKKSGDRQKTVEELPAETLADFGTFLKALTRITHQLLTLRVNGIP